MIKGLKKLELISLVCVLACIITYALGFPAFNMDAVISQYDDHNYYTNTLMFVMFALGIIFTLAVICYVVLGRVKAKNAIIVNIVIGVWKLLVSVGAISMAESLVVETIWMNDLTEVVEEVSNFHANAILVMLYVMIILSILHLIIAIWSMVVMKNQYYAQLEANTGWRLKLTKALVMPLTVSIVVFLSTIISVIYLYGHVALVLAIPYLLVWCVPVAIWLCVVVKRWEDEGKYLSAMISYIINVVLVYGVVHSLFFESLSFITPFYMLGNNVDEVLIGLINLAVAVIAAIVLGVKWAMSKVRGQGKMVEGVIYPKQ